MKKRLSVLTLLMALGLVACGSESYELQIGQAYYGAHGTKAFALASVVIEDDTIISAYIDEFQYLSKDESTSIPNGEHLVDYVIEGYTLGSKKVNNEMYSKNMEESGSTQDILDSYNAIEEYVVGKTLTELTALEEKDPEEVVDVVSGSTLVDTKGYLTTILLAAKNAQENDEVVYEGNLNDLRFNQVYGAAHGTKCFTITSVLSDPNKVVLAYIDELQYLSSDAKGVPNSENFVSYVTDGFVLGSKRMNDEMYSKNMATAGSTVNIADNYDYIQEYVSGKEIVELEELVNKDSEEVIDVVSGATLVDTVGYLKEIINAVK